MGQVTDLSLSLLLKLSYENVFSYKSRSLCQLFFISLHII